MSLEDLLKEMYHWAEAYIRSFYTEDADIHEKILLKEKHTWYVTEISRDLAAALGLREHDRILAEMIGLFHDIGRFKQYTIYRTFNDRESENHALLGMQEIEGLALLKRLDAADLAAFRFAIANHNAMRIAPVKEERQLLFAQMIRDADKLDIYRVLSPFLYPSDGSGINADFMACFLRGEQCDYTLIKTHDDQKLVRLLWMYDIHFSWTMQKIMERGYAAAIAKCLPDNAQVREGLKLLFAHMERKAAQP